MKTIKKKRRREGKTDYFARMNLLKKGIARLVVRKSNKYITCQIVESKNANDFVETSFNSRELKKYGLNGCSLKNLACSYLCGYVLGKKNQSKRSNIGYWVGKINKKIKNLCCSKRMY